MARRRGRGRGRGGKAGSAENKEAVENESMESEVSQSGTDDQWTVEEAEGDEDEVYGDENGENGSEIDDSLLNEDETGEMDLGDIAVEKTSSAEEPKEDTANQSEEAPMETEEPSNDIVKEPSDVEDKSSEKLTEEAKPEEEKPSETVAEEEAPSETPAEEEKETEKTEETETTGEATGEASEEKEKTPTDGEKTPTDGTKKEEKRRRRKKERTRPYELEKYWKAVKTNPGDFTGWTYLLQYVEQEDYMPFYREAFDAFFEHYPYCYGYWKKYADAERKKGSVDKCWEVFEHGLKAIPLSADLWLHYISVKGQQTPRSEKSRADKLRGLYERALEAAGKDFRSDKLWDQYINFEKKEQKDWKRVMQLYDRILKIPTQLYRHHFDKLKEFVQSHLPKEYLDLDEFLNLREQVVAEADPEQVDDDAGVPGEDAPPGEEAPPGLGAPSTRVIEGENKLIQEKVIESRRAVFRKTEQEVSKRWAYEEAIRRPYFHAKPLEKGQLKTWREYLEFEETTGNHERTVLLYERCLIACALYEEFWIKYARYMEKTGKDAASEVFKRACGIHLPTKPAINIQWAAFEEKYGNVDQARNILEQLQTRQQDSVMIRLERINFERRMGKSEEVIKLYEGCIDDAKTATGQSFFAGKLARFYQKVLGETDKAIEVLQKVLSQKQVSPVLKEQIYTLILDVEYQRSPLDEEKMTAVFDNVISSNIPHDVKIQFAQRKIQFLQDFGNNPAATHDAVDEHQKLVKNISSGKKRSADSSGDAPTNTSAAPSSDTKAPEKKKAKSGGADNDYNNSGGGGGGGNNYNNYNYNQQQSGSTGQAAGGSSGASANAGLSGADYPTSWSSWSAWGAATQ